ncbi:MAG: sugar phosphate isomerase/epimerase [Planctomycetes bacterium]|nr:sugar phosphate isomerase/epimerase [Planctomycetota bacterium]
MKKELSVNAGVSCYCFNKLLTGGEATLHGVIEFVGKETESEYFEPLTRFFDPEKDENEQAREARKLLDDVGLKASCYTLDSNFGTPDDAARRECIDRCIRRIETAQILGAPAIRLDPCTSLPKEVVEKGNLDDFLPRIAEGMREVADAAAKAGVDVGAENHGRMFGGYRHVAEMIRLVDRPNFGVNIDPTNFRIVFGEDHVENTRKLAPHVKHAHQKDYHIRKDQPSEDWREVRPGEFVKPCVVGEGDGRVKECVQVLHDAGYQGVIALETPGGGDIHEGVARGVANLRRIIAGCE